MNNIFKTICLMLTGAALASCAPDFPDNKDYPFISEIPGRHLKSHSPERRISKLERLVENSKVLSNRTFRGSLKALLTG